MDSWDWDDVINLEANAFQAGLEEGKNYEIDSEDESDVQQVKVEGQKFGFIKGYSIGLELGFMEAVILESEENLEDSISDCKDSTTPELVQSKKESSRIKKRRTELLQRIRDVPESNEAGTNIDFDTEIRAIRSLFSQCSLPMKSILEEFKSFNSQSSSEW
mmetsp:Transcript_15038/g.20620  ORF Transcript_15038/g.20620 Transcript_15038/m.20620 type:complete len:161 (-) Transcript_15038:2324-2806(-)